MLLWGRETGDAFKAAGRPHTGKVFVWPAERRQLDHYVEKLADEYDNVYVRKYLAATPEAAKRGEAPAQADRLHIEDAPADPPAWAPVYSYAVETSPYSRQAVYMLPRPLPWHQAERLAAGLAERLRADSGGPNPAQFIRVPTSRNTKARAGRHRVRFIEGIGPVDLSTLTAAALPGGLAELLGAGGAGDGGSRRRERSSESHDAAAWAGLLDGAALMASARYRSIFARRPQLARLARGERVVLSTAQGLKDTGSEQVAVLVQNLLTTGRKNSDGIFVPGLDAPPVAEVRAVALYWRETLRPSYPLGAYQSDVDRLIAEYAPAGYAPAPTRLLTRGTAPAPAPLAAPIHRGRPAGQRAAQVKRLAALLAERIGQVVTRAALADALGVQVRMVAEYLADLGERVELTRTRYGLRVVRCAIKSGAPDVQSPTAAEVADRTDVRNLVESAAQGSTHAPLAEPPVPASDHGAVVALSEAQERGEEPSEAPQAPQGGCVLPFPTFDEADHTGAPALPAAPAPGAAFILDLAAAVAGKAPGASSLAAVRARLAAEQAQPSTVAEAPPAALTRSAAAPHEPAPATPTAEKGEAPAPAELGACFAPVAAEESPAPRRRRRVRDFAPPDWHHAQLQALDELRAENGQGAPVQSPAAPEQPAAALMFPDIEALHAESRAAEEAAREAGKRYGVAKASGARRDELQRLGRACREAQKRAEELRERIGRQRERGLGLMLAATTSRPPSADARAQEGRSPAPAAAWGQASLFALGPPARAAPAPALCAD